MTDQGLRALAQGGCGPRLTSLALTGLSCFLTISTPLRDLLLTLFGASCLPLLLVSDYLPKELTASSALPSFFSGVPRAYHFDPMITQNWKSK